MIADKSRAMRICEALGFEGLAWSLRRLHCPVPASALVLEVGAGGNPYPRANVLLDNAEAAVDRVERDLVRDRPLVLGLIERLPFKDQAFDFAIASHVLEHSADPASCLSELMRVAKAGYIETPDAFFERLNPYACHRLELSDVGSQIRIKKKPSWRPATEIVELYERKVQGHDFVRFIATHPTRFHMRFYWEGVIQFIVVNPEVDAAWPLPPEAYQHPAMPARWRAAMRAAFLNMLRFLFSQNGRNRNVDLVSLLRCPSCRSNDVRRGENAMSCAACGASYPIERGAPVMYPRDYAAPDNRVPDIRT
jgi:uncharacterized protein YbaR (Trm112 family)/SAM-dependent methyltransferase